jgi:hypothetical protein
MGDRICGINDTALEPYPQDQHTLIGRYLNLKVAYKGVFVAGQTESIGFSRLALSADQRYSEKLRHAVCTTKVKCLRKDIMCLPTCRNDFS